MVYTQSQLHEDYSELNSVVYSKLVIWCYYLWMIHRARLGGRPAGIDSPSCTTKRRGMIVSERGCERGCENGDCRGGI
jgi:hypothetical protein